MYSTLTTTRIGRDLSYFIHNSGLDCDSLVLSVKKELTRKGKVIASPDFSTWEPTGENLSKLNSFTKCCIPYLFRLIHNPLSVLDTVAAYVANYSTNNIKLLEYFLSLVADLRFKDGTNLEMICYLAIYLGFLEYINVSKLNHVNNSSKVGICYSELLTSSFLDGEINFTKLHNLIDYLAIGKQRKRCIDALMYYYQVFSGIDYNAPNFTNICSSSHCNYYGTINTTSRKLQVDYISQSGFLNLCLASKIDEATLTQQLIRTLLSYACVEQVGCRDLKASSIIYLYLVEYGYLAKFDIAEFMGDLALIHFDGRVNGCFQVSNGVKTHI
jgi:hypothetical protein